MLSSAVYEIIQKNNTESTLLSVGEMKTSDKSQGCSHEYYNNVAAFCTTEIFAVFSATACWARCQVSHINVSHTRTTLWWFPFFHERRFDETAVIIDVRVGNMDGCEATNWLPVTDNRRWWGKRQDQHAGNFRVASPAWGVMGLLQLRYEHDSSTIRARFGYNTLQHATRFFVRSHTRLIRALHENQW